MTSKYTENVICLYCNKEVIRKNLNNLLSILLERIHFAPKSVTSIKQLLFEYRELFKFACETVGECQDNFSANHFVQNNLLVSMEVNSLSCIHSFPMLCLFQLLKQS